MCGILWQGLETKEPSYFITKENQERLARAQEKNLVQVIFLALLEVGSGSITCGIFM
jgi:hypothetical protein